MTVHVTPINDLIEHDSSGDDCPCGPTTEPVEREDGSMGWLVIHHSLDGREADEGQRLASERDDLIAAGVDPSELLIPLAPLRDPTEPSAPADQGEGGQESHE